MLTKIRGRDDTHVEVTSTEDDVIVVVASDATHLPFCSLSRAEAHDALLKARSAAHEFLAAVEDDIHATES